MRYESLSDPVEFQRRTTALLADEARHNLIRGILGIVIADKTAYEDFWLFVVADGSEAVAAALMTKPYNLILADVEDKAALVELVAGVLGDGFAVPGAIGNRPTVDWFVDEWREATGQVASLAMQQGVFALEHASPAGSVDGQARPAESGDADLVFAWMNEFIDEALPGEPRDEARLRKSIDRRIDGDGPNAIWLWERDGAPTAMTSHGSPTGSGIRIGGVYTPPAQRGNGYASALVSAQSVWLLENGYDFCFLFTDLTNPTSNAIYERIGYRQVAEGASYSFAPASPGT